MYIFFRIFNGKLNNLRLAPQKIFPFLFHFFYFFSLMSKMKIFRRSVKLLFGAGGTKGGVKKLDKGSGCDSYTQWILSGCTRQLLSNVHHVLIPEYLARLDEKHTKVEACLESDSVNDKLINRDGSPFDLVAWNIKYRDELQVANEFSNLARELDENVSLLSSMLPNIVMPPNSATVILPPNLPQSFSEEKRELLPLLMDDIHGLVDRIRSLDDAVESIMMRRLSQEDLLGSSTQKWKLSISGKAGGEEASLFAEDLADMLISYCKNQCEWNVSRCTDEGTLQDAVVSEGDITVMVNGDGVYRKLHHEIGVHKVQRVPVTDSSGKMQTSTAVVKLTPILNPVSVQVFEEDCKIDFVRGSGPGGQGMQSSSNCVVLTHHPSGISVKCHQSRSALGNKELALQMVSQQILARRIKKQNSSIHQAWNDQWSSGERSDKMRTYNFPQNRVTDHRIGRDYPLVVFMEGGDGLDSIHTELNAISDTQQISAILLKHIASDFGSEPC